MAIRLPAILMTTLCMATGNAHGDDSQFTGVDARQKLLIINHSTPLFADRWCIVTFIEKSRSFTAISTHSFRSGTRSFTLAPSHSLPDSPVYADESSPVSRLKALRTLRMMTLWQGRESALVFGLNESGYLGIRLDETLAHTN